MQEVEFMKILRANQGILIKVCTIYCSDSETRRDLYQEIILQLWCSFPAYREEAKLSTWIYRVAFNTAITDFRRSRKRGIRLELSEQLTQIPDLTSTPELQEKVQWLYRAVDTLSDTEKAIVMLYLDEKSYDEIAEIVGITPGNVRVKMHRILGKLRKLKID